MLSRFWSQSVQSCPTRLATGGSHLAFLGFRRFFEMLMLLNIRKNAGLLAELVKTA